MTKMQGNPWKENNLSRYSSTHLHSPLCLDLDLMGWVLWREWLEQRASRNFQTTRRSALYIKERNVRLRSTWIKFRWSAIVFHGLFRPTRNSRNWSRQTRGEDQAYRLFTELCHLGPFSKERLRKWKWSVLLLSKINKRNKIGKSAMTDVFPFDISFLNATPSIY